MWLIHVIFISLCGYFCFLLSWIIRKLIFRVCFSLLGCWSLSDILFSEGGATPWRGRRSVAVAHNLTPGDDLTHETWFWQHILTPNSSSHIDVWFRTSPHHSLMFFVSPPCRFLTCWLLPLYHESPTSGLQTVTGPVLWHGVHQYPNSVPDAVLDSVTDVVSNRNWYQMRYRAQAGYGTICATSHGTRPELVTDVVPGPNLCRVRVPELDVSRTPVQVWYPVPRVVDPWFSEQPACQKTTSWGEKKVTWRGPQPNVNMSRLEWENVLVFGRKS